MKYHVYHIALKDKDGNIAPREVAAPSLEEAINFLTRATGFTFAYEIKPI